MELFAYKSILTVVTILMPTGCAATISNSIDLATSGQYSLITTPDYPNNYPLNSDITWLIKSTVANTKVGLHITYYSIQYHPYCLYDNLTIFDGATSSATKIQTYCGDKSTYDTNPTTYLIATGQDLFLYFYSDEAESKKGFQAKAFLVDSNNCQLLSLGAEGRVNISSPWYSDNYKPNEERCWVVSVAAGNAGYKVGLDVLDLDLGTGDSLLVTDGSTASSSNLATVTGSVLPGRIRTTGQTMYLKFDSDGSSQGKGFIATVSLVDSDGCSTVNLGMGKVTQIMSPGYPSTPSRNKEWCWKVHTDVPDARVVLDVVDIDVITTVNCVSEFVSTHSGTSASSNIINKVCDVTGGSSVAQGGDMFIKMKTSLTASTERGLFAVAYISISECLTLANGKGFNGSLSRTMTGKTCQRWDTQTPHTHLFVNPSGFPETTLAEVNNYCRNPENGHPSLFCFTTVLGTNREDCYVPTCSAAPSVSVYQYCNYIYLPSNGQNVKFSSPGYPTDYPESQVLCWVLVTEGNILSVQYHVSLTIDSYHLENSTGCSDDNIKVLDGFSSSGAVRGTYCDVGGPVTITISKPFAYVQMTTDGDSNVGKGFGATARAVTVSNGCSEISPSVNNVLIIRSAGYKQNPKKSGPTSQCWKFKLYAPYADSHTIVVDFHQTVYFAGADTAYIRAYSGGNNAAPKILDVSTNKQPGAVMSKVELYMEYQSGNNDDGFEATVTVQRNPGTDENSCTNINLQDSTSTYTLSSPGYPTAVPILTIFSYCWHIIAPRSHTGLALRVLGADFGTSVCDQNNLMLHEGSSPTSAVLVKWCKTNTPTSGFIFNTNSTDVYIRLNTDKSVAFPGISVLIYPVNAVKDGCYEVKVAPGTRGLVTTNPFAGGFSFTDNIDCWSISILSTGANSYEDDLVLEITEMNIEGSGSNCPDSLVVQQVTGSGVTTTLNTLCGTVTTANPSTLVNTSATGMKLKLQNDGDNNVPSLNAYVYVLPNFQDAERTALVVHNPNGCTVILYNNQGDTGTITSPNYPNPYSPGTDACWIVAPDDAHNTKYTKYQMQISVSKLDTEFIEDCSSDYILIKDGASSDALDIVRFCGTNTPQIVTTSHGAVYFNFKADTGTNSRVGFSLTYTIIQGKKFDNCINVPIRSIEDLYQITSPGYPSRHGRSLDICWIVYMEGNDQYIPDIQVQDSKLEGSTAAGCSDYVAVYDGTLKIKNYQIVKWCAQTIPVEDMTACDGVLYVEFHADATTHERGFDANIKARKKSNVSKCDMLPLIIGAVMGGILALCIIIGVIACIALKYMKKNSKRSSRVHVAAPPPRQRPPGVMPMMNPMNTMAFQTVSNGRQAQQQGQPIRADYTGPPAYGATNPAYTNGYPPRALPPIMTNPADPPAYNARSPPPQYDMPPPTDRSTNDTSFTNIYSRNFATESSFSGGQSLDASSNDFYANQSQGSRSQLLPAYEPNQEPVAQPSPRRPPPQYQGGGGASVRDDDLAF